MRHWLFLLTSSLAVVQTASAQTTWIVDDTPGPGVQFTSLPAAVAAAASGDTLLVGPGTYQPFTVTGKALSIFGDGPATTSIELAPPAGSGPDYITITTPPVGTTFRLSGFRILRGTSSTVASNQLAIVGAGVSASGLVVLSDLLCQPASSASTSGRRGLTVQAITVQAHRCEFRAGWMASGFIGDLGDAGVTVNAGAIFAADTCTFVGGSPSAATATAALAGPGLQVSDATCLLTRSNLLGGNTPGVTTSNSLGGAGMYAFGNANVRIAGSPAIAIRGGDAGASPSSTGGVGIKIIAPAIVSVSGAPVIQGGLGASVAGVAISGPITLGLPARPELTVSGSAPTGGDLDAQQPVMLAIDRGPAGQLFVLLVDLEPGFAALPGLSAEPLWLGTIANILLFDVLDSAGHYDWTFVPTVLAPQLLGTPIHWQGFVLPAASSTWLGSNGEVRRFR